MRRITEERTRKQMIDPQLERAGWYLRDHAKVKIEIPAVPPFFAGVDDYDAFAWQVLELNALPGYRAVVQRQSEGYTTQHNYNADQIRFLRAVQSVFLQKHHLETADLYEPPLDMFGADAVERWFDEKEVNEIVAFTNKLVI